jgi:hypothetical protein
LYDVYNYLSGNYCTAGKMHGCGVGCHRDAAGRHLMDDETQRGRAEGHQHG